jgi:hypothetical protein
MGGAGCMRTRPRCMRKRLRPMPICPWMLVADMAGWMGAAAVPYVWPQAGDLFERQAEAVS